MDRESFDIAGFGRGIISRREALGWSSHRLAVKAKLADPYVRKLETGVGSRLGVDVIIKLARALDVPPDELLFDAGVETSTKLAGELEAVYQRLGSPERRALIRSGHSLRQMQTEYEARQAAEPSEQELRVAEEPAPYDPDEPSRTDNLAAADEDPEQFRQAQGWIDEEPP